MTEPLVPDDHDTEEEASYAEFRLTFFDDAEKLDDEGKPKPILGQIESHFHRVNEASLVDALLVLVRKIVADRMGESMFNERVPEVVRTTAADMLATNWLVNRMKSGELMESKPIEYAVPDDASELFKNE
jgi:hypothetical protein